MSHADFVPFDAIAGLRRGAIRPPAQFRMTWINPAVIRCITEAAMGKHRRRFNLHIRSQPVHHQFLCQPIRKGFGHIQPNALRCLRQEKIGDVLALRRQQGRVDKALLQLVDIICHQPLQKWTHIRARKFQYSPLGH